MDANIRPGAIRETSLDDDKWFRCQVNDDIVNSLMTKSTASHQLIHAYYMHYTHTHTRRMAYTCMRTGFRLIRHNTQWHCKMTLLIKEITADHGLGIRISCNLHNIVNITTVTRASASGSTWKRYGICHGIGSSSHMVDG